MLSFERKIRMYRMNRTMPKMLSAHASITAENTLSAPLPLLRLIKNSRIAECGKFPPEAGVPELFSGDTTGMGGLGVWATETMGGVTRVSLPVFPYTKLLILLAQIRMKLPRRIPPRQPRLKAI